MGFTTLPKVFSQSSLFSIYSLQNKGEAFWTVGDMLKAMNPQFETDRKVKSGVGFKKLGFSDLLVDEIVAASIRVNYGQDILVHKFVGMFLSDLNLPPTYNIS